MRLEEISGFKKELAGLPCGCVVRKRIAGKVRYYRQWVENWRKKSEYLAENRVDEVCSQIERRRQMEKQLRSLGIRRSRAARDAERAKTEKSLRDCASPVERWNRRSVFADILSFLRSPGGESKVLLVFGIRRTAKTGGYYVKEAKR